MNLIVNYMTNNDCYKSGRTITPKGIMVHSTATPGVMAATWFNAWNKPGVAKCVHAFVDDEGVCQYLPWNRRAWHAAGSANNTHIAFEMCESKDLNNKEYFDKVYANAVELTAMLCNQYGLTEKNVVCHCEGYKLGIASNHGDVMHWFPKHGKNMDTFRADVKKLLDIQNKVEKVVDNMDVKLLQHVLNKLDIKGKDGKALVEDGKAGPNTDYAKATLKSLLTEVLK